MKFLNAFVGLFSNFGNLTWQMAVMWGIGAMIDFGPLLEKPWLMLFGAAGISAFPMSARVIQKMAKEEDPYNFILMQSISANVSGQLGSIVAGGMVITLVGMMLGNVW